MFRKKAQTVGMLNVLYEKIKYLENKKKVGRPRVDLKNVILAFLKKLCYGLPYKVVAEEFNISETSLIRYCSLLKDNFNSIKWKNFKSKQIIIDSTFIETPYFSSKKYNGKYKRQGTKVTVVMTARGEVLDVFLSKGSEHDINFLYSNMYYILQYKPTHIYADKAYYCYGLRNFFEKKNIKFCCVNKGDSKIYKTRGKIECFFGKMKKFRELKMTALRSHSSYLLFFNFFLHFHYL